MPTISNAALYDSQAAKLEILESLVKTSRVYAPILQNHMKMVSTTGSRIEWFDQNLGNNSVTLSSAYTAGAGSMVISASSLVTPYSIKVGIHQLMTQSGSAVYNITNYNSSTNTLTIVLDQGSDANIASGTTLWLIRNSQVGEDFGAQSDVQAVTSDYNYISNFSFTVKIANPNKNGQLSYHFEDLTFENQLQNNIPEAIRTLERRIVKDFRVQGTGAVSRNGNTIQAGNGSRSGGIIALANARGLYTASSGSSAISEDILETDMIALRQRGAFTTINERTRDMGLNYCKVYCNETTLGDVNKLTRILRAPEAAFGVSDKIGGKLGTFATHVLANGVVDEFFPSDGLADNELLYVPQDDLIEVRILRMMEEQEPLYNGDNEVRMYNVTFATTVKSPWLLGYRSNLVRL